MLSLAIRTATGHVDDTGQRFENIGAARRAAELLADTLSDYCAVWLITGEPTGSHSAVLETFRGSRI